MPGNPAARLGDTTDHGGTIGPAVTGAAAQVNIGGQPAACQGDPQICPMAEAGKPHVGGFIATGSPTVNIGGQPAARVLDTIQCAGPPGTIAAGCPTVTIGDLGGSGGGGAGAGAPASAAAAPAPPPTYASTAPVSQPPGQSTQTAGVGTHWIELELVDEVEQGVPGEPYVVALPDGQKISGGLDVDGRVRINGIKQPGWCRIGFPNLDMAAWERWSPRPPKPPAGAAAKPPAPAISSPAKPAASTPAQPGQTPVCGTAPTSAPAGGHAHHGTGSGCGDRHQVLQGECISSIAKDTGHFWETIWNHPANADLKQKRGDPNVLAADDAVFVPPKRTRDDPGSTDLHHKYRRRGEPSFLRVTLKNEKGPRANEPYTLIVDGREFAGTTDAQGKIEQGIPGNSKRGELRVGPLDCQDCYQLQLGELDPINTFSGVQARLNNLGFFCGPADNVLNAPTRAAISGFQSANGLAVTGEPDSATRSKLLQRHGS